jgi:hypothetical protein
VCVCVCMCVCVYVCVCVCGFVLVYWCVSVAMRYRIERKVRRTTAHKIVSNLYLFTSIFFFLLLDYTL